MQAGPVTIPRADNGRVEACREAILSCQLKGGAIPQVGYRREGQPAAIEPYFASLACLGLLSAHAYRPDKRDLPYVERWLNWYAENQATDGTIAPLDGRRDPLGELKANPIPLLPDSHDSYAATYLTVAAEYVKASKVRPDEKIAAACRKCLDVLERCRDKENGLYWNYDARKTPDGRARAQYLLDNTEVYQGLSAAGGFFEAAGDDKAAGVVRLRAKALAGRMHRFWSAEHHYFVSVFGDNVPPRSAPWNQQPTAAEGLATVTALSFFGNVSAETRRVLWAKLMSTPRHRLAMKAGFTSAEYDREDPAIERVYLAALRAAPAGEQAELLLRLRMRADELIARNKQLADPTAAGLPYPRIHRYGMLIQALLAQTGRLPEQLPRVPLARQTGL